MIDTQNRPPKKHLDIRKYPNRRYYDATHSRHLTLEEIRAFVRDGHDIKVTDSKTGADITAQLLTQIILELETPKLETFPVNMLVQMIRANERVVGDFVSKYFDRAFTAYLEYQKQLKERLEKWHTAPAAMNPFTLWGQAFNPFAENPPSTFAEDAGKAADANEMRAVIAELQQQIAALQREVQKKPAKRKKAK